MYCKTTNSEKKVFFMEIKKHFESTIKKFKKVNQLKTYNLLSK